MNVFEPSATPVSTPVSAPVSTPHVPRYDVALLAAAPIVLALGRLVLVPFHDQDWNGMLTDMAAHHFRNALGWSLTLMAAALLTITGISLVRMVPNRPRLTVPALIGVTLGWVGTAAIASGGLVMGNMADSPDRDAMVQVLTNFNEGNGNTIFFFVLAGVIGNILLAVALARGQIIARGTAVLFGLGAVVSLVAAPGPVKAIAVTGAVMLTIAHFMIIRRVTQRSVR